MCSFKLVSFELVLQAMMNLINFFCFFHFLFSMTMSLASRCIEKRIYKNVP